MSTREAILAKAKRRFKEFSFDGETYRMQSLTERERSQYELQLQDKKGGVTNSSVEKMRRLLVAKTLVDKDGQRLFSDEEESLLADVDGRMMAILYDQAWKHCGYDKDELEDHLKNSDPAVA